MDTAREAIQKEIQEEVDARMYKIKKSLLDPAQGPVIFSQIGNSELRKKYANMTATDAVMEVFINSESVFNKSMTKVNNLEAMSGGSLSSLFKTNLPILRVCGLVFLVV